MLKRSNGSHLKKKWNDLSSVLDIWLCRTMKSEFWKEINARWYQRQRVEVVRGNALVLRIIRIHCRQTHLGSAIKHIQNESPAAPSALMRARSEEYTTRMVRVPCAGSGYTRVR
jgi:hypothetical protein